MSLGIQGYGDRAISSVTTEKSNKDKWTFKKVCTAAVEGIAVATFFTLMQMRRDLNRIGTAEIPTNLICGAVAGLGFVYARYFLFKERGIENYTSNLEQARQIKIELSTRKTTSTQDLVEKFIKNDSKRSEQ